MVVLPSVRVIFTFLANDQFLKSTLLPFTGEILTFYTRHYPRDEDGRIRFEPAQALETYWDSVNPAPEIAGLRSVLRTLLELPDTLTTDILGTALSVLGVQEGLALVEEMPKVEALFITFDERGRLRLIRSSGFAAFEAR